MQILWTNNHPGLPGRNNKSTCKKGEQVKIRKLHRISALAFAPFFILLSVSGCALLFRKSELYGKEIKKFLVSIHTWEIIAPYIGIIASLGLLTVVITGIIIFFKPRA